MQEYQNFTLRLPRGLVKRVKRLAVDRNSSASALMTTALEIMTRDGAQSDSYEAAHRSWQQAVANAQSLGTHGKATWTRDELHERR